VGGDFNSWMGQRDAAVALLRREFSSASPASGPTWKGPLGLHATLDHILIRGVASAILVRRLPSRFGSDHYPLLAIVDF
jgi:endonuclease/exonuclease/phosphatase (EEP) superfamily protein YafD